MYKTAVSAQKQPQEGWLKLSSEIGKLVRTWSGRTDVITIAGPDRGAGGGQAPTAFFDPYRNEIQVNTTTAFGEREPYTIPDFTELETQRAFPTASGVILHEAMHAKHTLFDLKELAAQVPATVIHFWIMQLEETRIENRGVRHFPKLRPFLRSSASEVALDLAGETRVLTGTRDAVQLALLSLGRVTAGVLNAKDVKKLRTVIEEVIPAPMLSAMTDIWTEYQSLQDTETANPRRIALAVELERLIVENETAREEENEDFGRGGQLAETLSEILRELAQELARDVITEINADQLQEARDKVHEANQKEQARQKKNKGIAAEVFGTDNSRDGTQTELESRRAPRPDERRAAVEVAKRLARAKYVDRTVTVTHGEMPPGRLSVRRAVEADGQRAAGVTVNGAPWRQKRRTHNDETPLSIGVLVDVSGSMGGVMEPMGVAAYVLSEAARRVEASVGIVNFGAGAKAVLTPGQYHQDVQVWTADDSAHNLDLGFRALDGAQNLLNGEGARLLVIVSDGNYGRDEMPRAEAVLRQCTASGVAVLWLDMNDTFGRHNSQDLCRKTNTARIALSSNITASALNIGRAAEEAINKAR
jgi:hypothetical protein